MSALLFITRSNKKVYNGWQLFRLPQNTKATPLVFFLLTAVSAYELTAYCPRQRIVFDFLILDKYQQITVFVLGYTWCGFPPKWSRILSEPSVTEN